VTARDAAIVLRDRWLDDDPGEREPALVPPTMSAGAGLDRRLAFASPRISRAHRHSGYAPGNRAELRYWSRAEPGARAAFWRQLLPTRGTNPLEPSGTG